MVPLLGMRTPLPWVGREVAGLQARRGDGRDQPGPLADASEIGGVGGRAGWPAREEALEPAGVVVIDAQGIHVHARGLEAIHPLSAAIWRDGDSREEAVLRPCE